MSKKGSLSDKLSRQRYNHRKASRNEIISDLSDIRLDTSDTSIHLKTGGELDRGIVEPVAIKPGKRHKPQQPHSNWAEYPENHQEGHYVTTLAPRRSQERWQDVVEQDDVSGEVPLDRIFRR